MEFSSRHAEASYQLRLNADLSEVRRTSLSGSPDVEGALLCRPETKRGGALSGVIGVYFAPRAGMLKAASSLTLPGTPFGNNGRQ